MRKIVPGQIAQGSLDSDGVQLLRDNDQSRRGSSSTSALVSVIVTTGSHGKMSPPPQAPTIKVLGVEVRSDRRSLEALSGIFTLWW